MQSVWASFFPLIFSSKMFSFYKFQDKVDVQKMFMWRVCMCVYSYVGYSILRPLKLTKFSSNFGSFIYDIFNSYIDINTSMILQNTYNIYSIHKKSFKNVEKSINKIY